MTQGWIDYAALKEAADMEAVLAHYDIRIPRARRKFNVRCPFHDDREPSCGIDLDKKTFHCFGCGAKGNVLDFVQRMEGGTLPEAAEALAELSAIDLPRRERGEVAARQPARGHRSPVARRKGSGTTKERSAPRNGPVEPSAGSPDPEAINPPLKFELRRLDPHHPYLAARGLSPATVEAFGLGVCPETSRSMMKGRLCIPIRNEQGALVAYAGRWPADEVPEGELRYKLPEGFHKSHVLFNLHRVAGESHLVVVEGYFGAFRLHQLGVPVVALMGQSCSQEQVALLRQSGVTHLTLLLDGDEPGRAAAETLALQLGRSFFVRLADLPDDEQPDTVEEAELRELLDLPE